MEKLKTLVALILCLSCAAFAEDKTKLVMSLQDAIQYAMENNSDIRTQEVTLKNANIADKFSWNSVSPTGSLSSSWTGDMENETTKASITGSISSSLSANLYTTMRAARLNLDKEKINYSDIKRSVEKDVRKAFFNILYDKEYYNLKLRNLETSLDQYKSNQEKFDHGKISELDVMTSRVNYEQKKPDVEQAELTYLDDLNSFKKLIGLDQGVELELQGNLEEEKNINKISSLPSIDNAPSVLKYKTALSIAKNSLTSSRFSCYSPSVSASLTYGKSRDLKNETDVTTNNLTIGVSVPLDGYLPWSSRAVSTYTSHSSVTQAKINLEEQKVSVEVTAESLVRKINQSLSSLESLKQTLLLAEKTYEMTKTAYNYGKTDIQNLQDASDNVLTAAVNVKSKANTLISSLLDLEYLLGLDFESLGE